MSKKKDQCEEHGEHVEQRLQPILDIIPSIAEGDFSKRLEIPKKRDEFTELYANINFLIDDLQEQLKKRRQMEEALGESEEKYRTLFDNSPEGIILLGLDGTILNCNNVAEEIGGIKKVEIIGKQFREIGLFDEECLVNLLELFPKVIREELRNTLELTIQVGNNKKWIEVFPALLKKNNEVYALQLIVRDITERKKAEEALRESEEKYRNLVERANDGIVIIQDGIIKYVNPRCVDLAGFTVEEITDSPFIDYIHPDHVSKVVDRYKRRIAGEDVNTLYEIIIKRKDGNDLYAEINASIISYQGKPADFVIIRDITERKCAEEKLHKTISDLERFNQLTIGRELRMIELKREVNDLLHTLGHKEKYEITNPRGIENKKEE